MAVALGIFICISLVLLAVCLVQLLWARRYLSKMYDDGITLLDLDEDLEQYYENLERILTLPEFHNDKAVTTIADETLEMRAKINAYRDLIDFVAEDDRIEVYERHLEGEGVEEESKKLWAEYHSRRLGSESAHKTLKQAQRFRFKTRN